MRTRTLLVALLAALSAVVLVSGAAASGGAPQPYTVTQASLVQSAQQLTLTVGLRTGFQPAGLRRQHRSLCLLIEPPSGSSVTGQLCVIGPRAGGAYPRLVYQTVSGGQPGVAHVVAANVRQPRPDELTVTFTPAAFGGQYVPLRWQVRNTLAVSGCRSGGGRPCRTVYPAKPALASLHVPQLVGCVPSGAPFVTAGATDAREIALTFDDGPWSDTPQFLDILEQYHVPATFFEIGEQISEYGQGGAVERRMLADGDMIGDHTWSHPDVAGAGAFAQGQIEQAAAAIRTATGGFTPCLFRAPYGDVSPALITQARSLGFTTIQWDIDPRDWALPGVGAIVANVLHNAHPGAIIIQHDGGGNRSQTLAALPQEITGLRRAGYTFVTVTQLLGQKLVYR